MSGVRWWQDSAYDRRDPMHFPDPAGHFRRVALTTEAVMVTPEKGRPRLAVVNRHPHEALRIYVSSRKARATRP
jgi:hypothetical protein